MALDAFSAHLGLDQGRLEGNGGRAVFVLGSLTPGRVFELGVGDYAEVVQEADLTNVDLIRVDATVTTANAPAGLAWELAIRVDGAARSARRLRNATGVRVRDLAANVAGLVGPHEVAVRLELVRS